jgi:hypothetical protein
VKARPLRPYARREFWKEFSCEEDSLSYRGLHSATTASGATISTVGYLVTCFMTGVAVIYDIRSARYWPFGTAHARVRLGELRNEQEQFQKVKPISTHDKH